MKRRQTEQIAVVLRDSGVPAEYSLAPNDGNGFARLVNNVEKFLEKHLGRPLSGEWLG